MDDAFTRALQRIRELEKELTELKSFLRIYARFSGTRLETLDPTLARELSATERVETQAAISRRALRPRANPSEYADLAAGLIRGENRPLSRTELVAALERQGVELPSMDKPRYIGTILWRNRHRFVNMPGKGYYLSDLMTPEEIVEARKLSESGNGDKLTEDLELELAALAQEFRETLDQETVKRLREWLKKESAIPQEIDGRLLAVSRTKARRNHFTDEEKRILRAKFKEALVQ